jgi:hypothetical protein
MHSFEYMFCMPLLASLLPTVEARRIRSGGGGGGTSFSSASTFVSPSPLITADLAFAALFLAISLFQLAVATSRRASGHRIPAIAIKFALAFLALSYLLVLALDISSWMVDIFTGLSVVPFATLLNLETAAILFWDWSDAMVFAAVALVLRDRHLSSDRGEQTPALILPLAIGSFIFALMWIFTSAYVGESVNATINVFNGIIGPDQATQQINISHDIFYTYIAIYCLATLFLLVYGVVVNTNSRGDKVRARLLLLVLTKIA